MSASESEFLLRLDEFMKKIISIILIIGSLTLAFLIILGARSQNTTQPKLNPPLAQLSPSPALVITPISPSQLKPSKVNSTPVSFTTTENPAIQKVVRDLITETGMENVSPEDLVEKVITAQLETMDYADLNPIIEVSKLKIIANPNKADREKYFQTIQAVLTDYFTKIGPYVARDPSTFNIEYFDALQKVQADLVTQLYAMPVPKDSLDAHREKLRLLTIQKQAFENMKNYETDPLKAVVAAYTFQESGRQINDLVQILSDFNNVQ